MTTLAARLLIFLALGFAAGANAGALAADRPVLDWLSYDPSTLAAYEVDTDGGDTARHVAVPSGRAASKRVMILIPSRSVEAYTLAVNTILQVFARRQVPARFDIWYYDNDETVALEAALVGTPVITVNLTGAFAAVPYADLGVSREVTDAEGLRAALGDAVAGGLPSFQSSPEVRRGVEYLVGPCDGRSAARVADVIVEMLDAPSPEAAG